MILSVHYELVAKVLLKSISLPVYTVQGWFPSMHCTSHTIPVYRWKPKPSTINITWLIAYMSTWPRFRTSRGCDRWDTIRRMQSVGSLVNSMSPAGDGLGSSNICSCSCFFVLRSDLILESVLRTANPIKCCLLPINKIPANQKL